MSGPEVMQMTETENQTSTSDEVLEGQGGGANATETAPNGAGKSNDANTEGTIPTEVDVLRRETASANERADHFQRVHDTAAGKNGTTISNLQDRIRALEAGGGRGSSEYDDPSDGRRNDVAPITDPRIDQLIDRDHEKADRENRQDADDAYNRSVAKFDSTFPNLDKAISADIAAFVNENRGEVSKAHRAGDAGATGREMDTLLNRAIRHSIAKRRETNVVGEKERVEKLNAQKRDASAPGRQSSGAGYREDRSPQTSEATLEELKAEYRRRGRRGF